MNTYVYFIGKKIYLNLTNRCSNACDFCIRKGRQGMENQPLWLEREPTGEDVAEQLPSNLADYDEEVVICGFGEPTYNMDAIIDVADFLHCVGKTIRLNTNGQGNLINEGDIVPTLADCVDVVSISLNMPDASKYQKVCHSVYGEKAFDEILKFATACKNAGIKTVLSVVDVIGAKDVALSQKVADSLRIPLRVRKFE